MSGELDITNEAWLRLDMKNYDRMFWILVSLFLASLCYFYSQIALSPDQALYSYVGWRVAEGDMLYVDAGEHNFPGMMWVHGLAMFLFGRHEWSWRLLEFITLVASIPALNRLLPFPKNSFQSKAVWFVWPLVYTTSGGWFSGQRDIFIGMLLVLSGVSFVRRSHGGHPLHAVVVGATLLVVTVIRPTFALHGALLIAVAFLTRKATGASLKDIWLSIGITGLSFFVLLGIVSLRLISTGGAQGFVEQAFDYNFAVYIEPVDYQRYADFLQAYLIQWLPLLIISAFGVWLWVKSRSHVVEGYVLLAITITTIVSYIVQGKGFSYHLGSFQPVLAGLASVALGWALQSWPRQKMVAGAIVLTTVLNLANSIRGGLDEPVKVLVGLQTRDEMRADSVMGGLNLVHLYDAAEVIQRYVPEDQTVITHERLLLLSFIAGRAIPYRYSNTAMVELALPPFKHAEAWQTEVLEILSKDPPGALFVRHDEDGRIHFLKPDEPNRYTKWLETTVKTYVEVGRWDDFRLYVRPDLAHAAPQ